MKTPFDPRHQKRRKAIQSLFAWAFRRGETKNILASQVISNLEKIDEIISKYAPEWPINQINKIDIAILRLAIYELLIVKSEPPKVIIDEAVELAKEFGSESSPSFVNGVLGAVLKDYGKPN
jgi:N utilization substance protein B